MFAKFIHRKSPGDGAVASLPSLTVTVMVALLLAAGVKFNCLPLGLV
jgi:hypothetical protein